MAASEVAICNLALSNIRSSKFIESLTEGSVESEICNLHYADTRDYVLRRANWPFARKRLALVLSGTPPPNWAFSYALPSDCITAVGVQDGTITSSNTWFFLPWDNQYVSNLSAFELRPKYAIENDGTGSGKLIYMNIETAVLIYTMRATDPTIYPSEFVEALSWKLASNICRPLDKDVSVCTQTLQIADQLIMRAAAMSYNEDKPYPQPKSDLFTSRLGN